VDCYINKIDRIPDNPYKEDDFMKEHGEPLPGPAPNMPSDPFKGVRLPDPLPGYPYIPLTGTGTEPFEVQPDTTGTEPTYNPWFRRTWANCSSAQDSSTMVFSTGTDSQNLGN